MLELLERLGGPARVLATARTRLMEVTEADRQHRRAEGQRPDPNAESKAGAMQACALRELLDSPSPAPQGAATRRDDPTRARRVSRS